MDRFDAMTAFVAVADRRGFAPAARALGLSPSAVTRLIADLESRLGLRLLQRTTRAVHLTDAGARFLERARRLLADLDEAERLAETEKVTPSGRLTLTAPHLFGRLHVAPLISAYLARYPGVVAELTLNDRNMHLVDEGIDLALRIGHLADSTDIARRVGSARRVTVASPDYLARSGTPTHPSDLAAHRLITCTALGPPDLWRFTSDLPTAPAFLTNSAEAALWHAETGGGLTQLISYQVFDAVKEGRLSLVLEPFEIPPLPIQFVYPSARFLSVKVRALMDLARETCDWTFLAP